MLSRDCPPHASCTCRVCRKADVREGLVSGHVAVATSSHRQNTDAYSYVRGQLHQMTGFSFHIRPPCCLAETLLTPCFRKLCPILEEHRQQVT